MKILQINNCHYRRGGADVVYLNTGELLEKYGHEVFYFSQGNKQNVISSTSGYFIKEKNYLGKSFLGKVFSLPRFFYSFEAKNKISKLLIKFRPEIAHVHLFKADLTPSILTSLKRNKTPTIITLHDLGLLCPHNLMLDGKLNLCSRCVNHSPLNCIIHKCNRNNLIFSTISSFEYIYQTTFFPFNKYFNRIITVSKFSQNLHVDSNYFTIPIKHLYNIFPNLLVTKTNNKKGNYFLYLGRLSSEKGINLLVEAWLNKKRKSKLIIAGTGELMDEIKKGTSNTSIELIGYKSGEELSNLIFNASFIIIPSICYENNPLTIIEAYSYGKPVIGSNIGGIPEIIENGKTGFLFTMKNANELSAKIEMAENISDDEYREMSVNARNFAEKNFNEESHYEKLMSIYNSAINEYSK